jgi:hypothetical protein
MTSVFQTRRRAEEFAAALDGAGPRRAGSEEITDLLQVVDTLRSQPQVAPRASFTGELRSRLMTEAEATLRPETANLLLPVGRPGRRERRLAAAASALVLVGGTATMAAASQSSLPGDTLYPIKRGIERAEVGLSMSEAGKGEQLLTHASQRLVEVERLVRSGSVQSGPRVPETLGEFSESAAAGSALLFRAFEDSGDVGVVVAVRTFATDGVATLEGLAAQVPSDVQDDLSAAALLLREIDREAVSLCGSCADLPVVEVPDTFLARAEIDAALDRAAGASLDNSHPVVVPKGVVPATETSAATTGSPSAQAAPKPQPVPESEDEASAAPSPPLPSPTLAQPAPWPTPLPDLGGEEVTTGDTTGDETVSEDLADGLTGVVETLLPDTDTGLID